MEKTGSIIARSIRANANVAADFAKEGLALGVGATLGYKLVNWATKRIADLMVQRKEAPKAKRRAA